MLELLALGEMRISKQLKMTHSDLNDRRLTLRESKSEKEHEFIFVPLMQVDRLED